MKEKKYIVIVYGVLRFSNGKNVESGGFVPSGISNEEIEDKLKRKQIAVFDDKVTALVQASNNDNVNIVKELRNKIENLEIEVELLKEENEKLEKDLNSLKSKPRRTSKGSN